MNTPDVNELARELQARSQDVAGHHPIDLAGVKRRARQIRRRRTVVTSAVAALAVAAVAPAGLVLSGVVTTLEGPDRPPIAGEPSPTSTSSPASTSDGEQRSQGTTRLSLDGLERGENPRIPYLDRKTLVTPDGKRVALDGAYSWITPYARGWLVGSWGESGSELTFLDADGSAQRSQPGSQAVVDASGTFVAYVAAEGASEEPQLVIAPTMGSEGAKVQIPVDPSATPVGFLSEDDVVYKIETDDGQEGTFIAHAPRTSEQVPGVLRAWSATGHGLIAAMTRQQDFGSCSAVIEADGFDRRWETCDFSLGAFSADARYVLGTDPFLDGVGQSQVAILDARSGEVVAHYQKRDSDAVYVNNMVWEDRTHVLATVFDDGRWAVVRMDTNGGMELATDPVRGSDVDCPFFFSLQP